MKPEFKLPWSPRKAPATLLGLALDGARLDGVVLHRTDGGLQKLQEFSVALTLDPLGAAPELAGREIRNQLDAAGVHERQCIVGLPLKWVLTAHTELPPLPAADAASLLQLEAERGFSSDVTGLQIGDSRGALSGDRQYVLLAGIPNTQLDALEKVLAAARLKPVSFALGICALQPPTTAGGTLALVIGENSVGLQITVGGGIVALRALEGTIENETGRRTLVTAEVAREARVTLGQLPEDLRTAVTTIRIFGPRELAQPLADELELRFEPMGLNVDLVEQYGGNEFGPLVLPPKSAVSAAFSLAARGLTTPNPPFQFLPPKPSALEQYLAKYTSGRLGTSGAVAAGVAVLVGLCFLAQQIELWHFRSQWSHMSAKVAELQGIEDQISQFRPWYDDTHRSLSILRQLTLAFPEDGSVTAKTIEIRDGSQINLSGTARDNASLLAMQARLRAAEGVSAVRVDQIRGKAPIQFSFDFEYGNGGANAN
jgi:hypothetical protein